MILVHKNFVKLAIALLLICLFIWKILPLFDLAVVDNNKKNNINANVYFYTENEEVYNKILR